MNKHIEDDDYETNAQLELVIPEKKKSNAELLNELLNKINQVEEKRRVKNKKAI